MMRDPIGAVHLAMPIKSTAKSPEQRNRGYQKSHQQMLATAVRLISEQGLAALSLAGLARAMEVNRTTIYYHFEDRECLVSEVKAWASEQLAKGLDVHMPRVDRVDYITCFVLENPELIKLWLDDLLSGTNIAECYPVWAEFVASTDAVFKSQGQTVDAEIFCLDLLISAIVTPLAFTKSVQPGLTREQLLSRFRAERLRNLALENLLDLPEQATKP